MREKSFYHGCAVGVMAVFFIFFIYLLFSISEDGSLRKRQFAENKEIIPAISVEKIGKSDYVPHFEKVSYKDLPGFQNDNFAEAYPALLKSCDKILFSPRDRLVKKVYWDQACKALADIKLVTDSTVRNVITKYFDPFLVYDKNGETVGLFTGYYSAGLNASYKKTEKYKYPVYKLPADALTLNTDAFADCSRCVYTVRVKDGKIIPYYTTADIMKNNVISDKDVLLWADNPIDVMLMHIQGSGVAVMPDKKEIKINYAGNNGYNFVGMGWILKSLDLLENGKGSMPDVKEWLEKNSSRADELISRNPRYIFFKEAVNNEGPIGSLGVELTPERSLAVDSRYIKLGSFIWLVTKDADGNKIEKLVTAQDTGAAIKGEIRGDFYFGYGDKAFHKAGRMRSKGSYYLFLPKEKLL